MFRVLLAVVLACSCGLILADEQDPKINEIFKDFKKAEDAFADVVRGVDADALDDFDDRIKNAGKRGGVEAVERWNQQKKQYIRTRAMNQGDKNARYTRMVLLAAGSVSKISKAFNALEDSHKAALKKASDANEVDVLVTLNAEWRKLLPFIDPEVKDGLQALRYYCLEANDAAGPDANQPPDQINNNPQPMAPQGEVKKPLQGGPPELGEVNADGVSVKCLQLFGELPSEVLYDRLKTQDEKRTCFFLFVREFCKKYPPVDWTINDANYFVNKIVDVAYSCETTCGFTTAGARDFQTLTTNSKKDKTRPEWQGTAWTYAMSWYVAWLFSSPDTDSFIERRSYLKRQDDTKHLEVYWEDSYRKFPPVILRHHDHLSFFQGDFKEIFRMWLGQHLDTPEEIKAFVMKLQSKNLSFPQANEILNEINSP